MHVSRRSLPLLDVSVYLCVFYKNVPLLSPHPMDQEQGFHPFAKLHPKKQLPILWNCETLTIASSISNLWEQMFDFRRYIKCLPKLMLSFQDLRQNLSLETVPIDNAEPYYPHDNMVEDHSCDECTLVSDRANLFTDQRMSSRPILAKQNHFKTI